ATAGRWGNCARSTHAAMEHVARAQTWFYGAASQPEASNDGRLLVAALTREQPSHHVALRGGRVFLDRKPGLLKWMNCSIVTAAMPMQRSSHHEAYTKEPL